MTTTDEPPAPRRTYDPTREALAAACTELEETGARATAHPLPGAGWKLEVTMPDGAVALEAFHLEPMDDGTTFPPNAAGHRLIERGWMPRSCAHFAHDRSAGWKQDRDEPRVWTAPVVRTEQPIDWDVPAGGGRS